MFVVAPFLWALSTSFKDFNSVTGGATYIPWVDFEPSLEGWRVLLRSPAQGGVNIVEPYFNSIVVTCSASFISIFLGTFHLEMKQIPGSRREKASIYYAGP